MMCKGSSFKLGCWETNFLFKTYFFFLAPGRQLSGVCSLYRESWRRKIFTFVLYYVYNIIITPFPVEWDGPDTYSPHNIIYTYPHPVSNE